MRILAASGEFILPLNFQTTLTRYNVMLTASGEQTIPFTLPPEPINLKLVGWSNRTDAVYKPLTDIAVTIVDGLYIRPGNLGIHTSDDEDGISCTLYMGTADFYSRVGDAKLASLPWPVVKSPDYDEENGFEQIDYLIQLLKTYSATSDYVVCPLVTTQKFKYRVIKQPGNVVTDIESNFILNWFEQYQHTLDFTGTGTDILSEYQSEYEQQIVVGDDVIDLGIGYGMTPFLKLSYVLCFIFEHYGYTFDTRDIEDELNEFAGMFIINNVADAIYSGILKYSQLLPDMTIKGFIAELEKWFCGKFVINQNSKLINFSFFKNNDFYTGTAIDSYLSSKIKPLKYESEKVVLDINGSFNKDNEQKATPIELKYPKNNTVECEFSYIGSSTSGYFIYRFYMLGIDGIIHQNSAIEIDGKIEIEDAKSPTDLQIGYYNRSLETAIEFPSNTATLYYYTSFPMFGTFDVEDVVSNLYQLFFNFKLNSNIPLTAKFNFPTTVLESLDITKPVTIQAQKCLFEKIEYPIGNNQEKQQTQNVTLRTLRSYQDRP